MTTIEKTALLTSDRRQRGGFLTIAPELVVEIVSPNDLWRDLQDKIREYFAVGVFQVWIIDPEIETIWRYRSPGEVELLERGSVLHGEGTLSGFSVSLDEFFAEE